MCLAAVPPLWAIAWLLSKAKVLALPVTAVLLCLLLRFGFRIAQLKSFMTSPVIGLRRNRLDYTAN